MAYRKNSLIKDVCILKLAHKKSECNFQFHELNCQTLILFGIGEYGDTYFQEQDLHVQGRGGGGFATKPRIRFEFV